MKTSTIATGFLSILMIISCSSPTKKQETSMVAKSAIMESYNIKPEAKSNVYLSDFVNKIDYIPLKTKDNTIIGSVDKLEIKDSLFYFLDKKSQVIWCYNDNGDFIFKIDKKGHGPGEYIKIFDFNIDYKNNCIVVLDRNMRKLLFYDMSGNYLRDLKINVAASQFAILNNKFLFYTFGADSQMKNSTPSVNYNLFLANEEGQILSSYFPYNKITDNFIGFNVFDKNDSILLFRYANNDTVYKFNNEGNCLGKILFDFGDYRRPIEHIDSEETYTNILNNPSYAAISKALRSDKITYITYNYKGRVRFLILENNTKKYINGSMLINDIDDIAFLNPTPIKVLNNKIYFVKEASEIYRQKKDNEKIYLKIKELSELDEDSNPIIAIFDLKDK